MSFRNRWRIGHTIPVILVVAFVLDVAARFFPLDWLSFRGWEALVRYHAPCGPFRANASYANSLSYGDLASMGNMPEYRQYRQEIFSTDGFGFRRNSHLLAYPSKYEVILVGDSMAVGTGVNDEATLAAQLEPYLESRVYNGAGPVTDPKFDHILSLARRLNITNGTVLYEYVERDNLPRPEEIFGDTFSKEKHSACQNLATRLSVWYEGFIETSPLKIIAQQIFRKLQNDSILPNIFKSNVVSKTLRKGEPILFYPPDVANFITNARTGRSVDVSGLRGLAVELEKHDLRLVVVLVPDKYTVYQPLLKEDDMEKHAQELYLNVVEGALKEAGIPVINLVNVFRQKAQEYYQKDLYIYWRDDTHWNAKGIELAAEEILKQDFLH